jgi:hypothetical protein
MDCSRVVPVGCRGVEWSVVMSINNNNNYDNDNNNNNNSLHPRKKKRIKN